MKLFILLFNNTLSSTGRLRKSIGSSKQTRSRITWISLYSLLSHINPVSWENVMLYGDYVLNRNKVVL